MCLKGESPDAMNVEDLANIWQRQFLQGKDI